MTVGLALIARDEERNLPALLSSIEGAFDQVVLADTGSEDGTCELFSRWAAAEHDRNSAFAHRLERFRWRDDFASARAFADSLLDTEWTVWADADDEIRGAGHLREVAAEAPADVAGYMAGYVFARHPITGRCLSYLKRERLVRRGRGEWSGRVHETKSVAGRLAEIPPDLVLWVHRRPLELRAGRIEQNVRILQRWHEDDPDNQRVLQLLGKAEASRGMHESAIARYRRCVELRGRWDDAQAQLHRKLASSLLALGRAEEALHCGEVASQAVPSWPDSYLTLAEASLALGRPGDALRWARRALELGQPDTPLLIKPLDYVLQPRVLIARALRELDRPADAAAMASEAIALCGAEVAAEAEA
jgi:tetratricopeptide (TPR) repeat protein